MPHQPAKDNPGKQEPGRTPGQAEGGRKGRETPQAEPGRTPGQAEGTEEDVENALAEKKQRSR